MKKSELLRAIREEIQRHNLDTFMSAEHKIVETGCSMSCRRCWIDFRVKVKPEVARIHLRIHA